MLQERFISPRTENPIEAKLLQGKASEISFFAKVKQRFGQMLDRASDAKLKIALAAILVPAIAACGGGEVKGEGGNADNPTIVPPARTAETSSIQLTATPTEAPKPTATPESLPKVEDVAKAINAGFTGITIPTPDQLPNVSHRSVVGLQSLLNNCVATARVTFVDGSIIDANNPNFPSAVLGNCRNFGEATKKLYELTGKVEFRQANQDAIPIVKARIREFKLPDSVWSVIEPFFSVPSK